MKWKNPTLANPTLVLPVLQMSKHIDLEAIEHAKVPISISVESAFIEAWHNGPKSDSKSDLLKCIDTIGRAFCTLILDGINQITVTYKTSPADMVTEMDQGIEMLFRIWMQHHCPSHKIVGEEGHKDQIAQEDIIWYVDPIDGTKNFIEKDPRFALHLGAVQNGKPYMTFFGLPALKRYFALGEKDPRPPAKKDPESQLTIGTEYLPTDENQDDLYLRVLSALSAKEHRVNSIGLNLLDMLEGKVTVFYKPRVKLWDIIAPLNLIYFYGSDDFEFELFYPKSLDNLASHDLEKTTPFSCEPNVVDWLNIRHQDNCRVGFLIIYPKSMTAIRDQIIETVFAR